MDTEKKYFIMMNFYIKGQPEDYGLINTNSALVYENPLDHTKWGVVTLHGRDSMDVVGFELLPPLAFSELFELLERSLIEDNRYGAAEVLLSRYSIELLNKCLDIINLYSRQNSKKYMSKDMKKKLKHHISILKVLKLDKPNNLGPTLNISYDELSKRFEQWKSIADFIKQYG